MHHAHMPKQRYQHHTTVRTWNHKSGMQPRKVSAKLATTTGWGWGWGYQNVSVFYLHIFPSTSKFCVLIVCIFCFALLLSFMYQINTKIQTHQVDEIFSEKAYSTEGYLSPESFPLLSFMPLGKGKIGTVFHAWGPVGNGSIAVKIIPKEENDEDEVRVKEHKDHIKNEINIQSGLCHENLLQLHSYFAKKDCFCLALEYTSGGSLRMQEQPLFAKTSAKYIREVCSGLGHMHKKHGIIHRDVKIENLVLGSDGRVKIIDFGVAGWFLPSRWNNVQLNGWKNMRGGRRVLCGHLHRWVSWICPGPRQPLNLDQVLVDATSAGFHS